MVLGHRDLLAGAAAHRISRLGVLDEEVGASCCFFSARDVGRHVFLRALSGFFVAGGLWRLITDC